MKDMKEPYEHYYDKYRDAEKKYDDYYEHLAENQDADWSDNCE